MGNHPHIHAVTSYGAFTREGTFIALPDDLSCTPFLKIWESKIFKLLLDEGRITQEVVDQMRSWKHSGFSVDKSVALAAGNTAGLERLAAYIVRCPFSLDRIISAGDGDKVVYRAEKNHLPPVSHPRRREAPSGSLPQL